ncbi:hypothetical protein Asp14428_20300 [Actinoplanes sp. NBRC 14428]|uniref:XdhC-like protein n=1 Tax=Pseudosporangium ferrugineum TaxID=439699 RepID=A0A2T0RF94_9ACTN|nr:XdhC family protein [Pseudosporangium ferrugineum]PRY19809.1 XdhC-like protein [Pseudosporangium ferrugineum]BCJ50555.1 hypothetical protein Asp14428_20300 [Actinoplanes sp. NBRC 14428]
MNSLLAEALGDRPRPGTVHAPAGLDLGARTPAEIATAVIGQILSVRPRRG